MTIIDDTSSGDATVDDGRAGDRTTITTGNHLHPKPEVYAVDLPEGRKFRFKRKLLGPAIPTDQLIHERLGKPTALAVFASDNLSSSAYASEEILRVLVPAVGVAAFSLVVPITIAMLAVLGLLILSYRQTIKAYPSAGGAYVVTRDNFGLLPAQVAGVALLTDYVLTVSVSVAAGTAALASAFDSLAPYILPISIVFVLIIAGGNLKGVKESGRAFAVPTYFFILNMLVLLGVAIYKSMTGGLAEHPIDLPGAVEIGSPGSGVLLGATMFVVLHAFASGGAAVTGVEAISNGVPAFKEPAWKNAQTTLVIMGGLLGLMFLGLSMIAAKMHPVPFEAGTPTVISQIGEFVYGPSTLGSVLYYSLQAGTMLILVLAANTSFADFPRLASFHADDDFMPRQLTKRGHRLVFSNGIIALAAAAILLLILTKASVERLIPLYAIGVFLSFTLSQAGMAKHHVTHKEPKWVFGLVVNAAGSFVSGVVCLVIGYTKFTHGAWAIVILVPVMVGLLFRLNTQYLKEEEVLERDAPLAAVAPIRTRHVVIVFIEKLDMASARAIQYARTLTPDAMSAVHFDLDPHESDKLVDSWQRLGFERIPLDVVSCYDRRLERAAAEVVARQLADNDTEVTVLLPRREHTRLWHRLVHDRTADLLTRTLSNLAHCNVTIVPFHLADPEGTILVSSRGAAGAAAAAVDAAAQRPSRSAKAVALEAADFELPAGATPIGRLSFRDEATVFGRVHAMRVQPMAGAATLELTLVDATGAIKLVFFGRRSLAGVKAGTRLRVTGRVGEHRKGTAMLNPVFEIQVPEHEHELPPAHG